MSIKTLGVLFLGVGSFAWAATVANFDDLKDGATLLIDDFSDGDLTSNLGYPWKTNMDAAGGEGTSVQKPEITTGNTSSAIANGEPFNALKMAYVLGTPCEDEGCYTPLVSISAYVAPVDDDVPTGRDISRCSELHYDYRGANHVVILYDYDAPDIGYMTHQSRLMKSSENWTSVKIVLKGMSVPDWVEEEPRDIETSLKKASSFLWQVQSTKEKGSLEIANVRCVNVVPPPVAYINQVGYRPDDVKMFTLSGSSGNVEILDKDNKVVLTVTPSEASTWQPAGMNVRQVDFTKLDKAGTYKIKAGGVVLREDLKILEKTYEDVVKKALKWYYYQRASIELIDDYAGDWAREAGHTDPTVTLHSSTGETGSIKSSKGWYDAGDYGRYTVNSGISTYTLLALYEHYPEYFKALKWNIPADGKLPDLLAEIKWNLEWMLTMQAKDGGVYHKLTSLDFEGTIMPAEDISLQYAIGKSTAGTFDFAAVMAVSARVYKAFDEEFAAKCLEAAKAAYAWGLKNPSQNYTENPSDVKTGEYKDDDPSDEKLFAGTELFVTTGEAEYRQNGTSPIVPYWGGMGGIATYDKAIRATDFEDGATAKAAILQTADEFVKRVGSGFGVVMANDDFTWGSNSVAANQGVWLLHAYYITGEKKYYEAAVKVVDYLLGKNPNDMSFVTGTGTTSPMHPHHRPSQSDGIDDPVPGMLVGGPQPGLDDKGLCSDYSTGFPATTYNDDDCSYATNEVAINWNAPLAYLTGAIEAINAGYLPEFAVKQSSSSSAVEGQSSSASVSSSSNSTEVSSSSTKSEAKSSSSAKTNAKSSSSTKSEAKSCSSAKTNAKSSSSTKSEAKSSSSGKTNTKSSSSTKNDKSLVNELRFDRVKFTFANNALTVVQPKPSMVQVRVFDMTGHLLDSKKEYVSGYGTFDMNMLTQGNYVIRVSSEFDQRTARISIK